MPKLVLLYTSDKKQSLQSIIAGMLDPAGVFVFGKSLIREEDVQWFDDRDLPLVLMDDRLKPMQFIHYFITVFSNAYEDNYWSKLWLKELCYTGTSHNSILNGNNGYCSNANYCCMLAEIQNSQNRNPFLREYTFTAVLSTMTHMNTVPKLRPLCFEDNDVMVLFLPWSKKEGAQIPYTRLKDTIKKMIHNMPDTSMKFFVGTAASSIDAFPESYRNAKSTKLFISSLDILEYVSFYDDWYMHMPLLKESRKDLEDHMNLLLHPLLLRPELFETLVTYFTLDKNLKLTAEHLFIHINTLKYRLKQISDLLDCDLKDPSTQFRLCMALMIHKYLQKT